MYTHFSFLLMIEFLPSEWILIRLIVGNEKTGGPKVYNVSEYGDEHPGGLDPLIKLAGKDADEEFED